MPPLPSHSEVICFNAFFSFSNSHVNKFSSWPCRACAQKDPTCLVWRCHCLEILNSLWTRGLRCSFCMKRPCKWYSPFWWKSTCQCTEQFFPKHFFPYGKRGKITAKCEKFSKFLWRVGFYAEHHAIVSFLNSPVDTITASIFFPKWGNEDLKRVHSLQVTELQRTEAGLSSVSKRPLRYLTVVSFHLEINGLKFNWTQVQPLFSGIRPGK